ncbi:MAG: PspC domain-containing protein [Gammaproteobacteria bacterium]|nr:PspC domain-containing protein [Gammaproteobacteria bacterium]
MTDPRFQRSREDASTHGPGGSDRHRSGDFQESVARLERAVDDLVGTARSRFSDRATSFIDETTERLEREIGRRPGHRTGGGDRLDAMPRKLYRDPARERIVGVCAGIARYYGVEPWVVRCIAVTGLLFFPTIVFPAYWIAYFVMEKPPKKDAEPLRERPRRYAHSSPTPELGPRWSPRDSLRNVQADLAEAELRLRRMETHVTSGQYELQRELHRIDGAPDDGPR